AADADRIRRALEFVGPLYGRRRLGTGEELARHVHGMALITPALRLDADSRLAAPLLAAPHLDAGSSSADPLDAVTARLGAGLHRLNGLRLLAPTPASGVRDVRTQPEVLRKMMLAMSEDVRVVLLRLASRTQTLRFYAENPGPDREATARESLDLYAPLANRL